MAGFGGGGSQNNGGGYPVGPNPANAAMPYLNQIPGIGRENYQPFINEGRQASGIANPVYNQMSQDPNEFLNSIMRNYNPSEGYRFKEREISRGLQNTAAQGGYAGTPNAQLQQGEMIRGLLGQDMQQFLQNILGVQNSGLQGQEQRIDRGYGASGDLADYLGNALGAQGALAFQGQAQQNQNEGNRYNSMMQQQNMNRQNRQAKRNSFFNLLSQGAGGAMGNMANGVGFNGFGG